MNADLELLRRAFPPKLILRLPKTAKRPALDYVSHAAVTDRLIAADPDWTWEVLDLFNFPHPEGNCWIHGRMTVGGVSREEYGHGPDPLQAASHFIRRGAMRFGVALDLWAKEELTEVSASSSPAQSEASTAPATVTSGRGGDSERGAEEAGIGEGPATSAPQSTPSGQPEGHHTHHWKPSPTMQGWRYCDVKGCGKAERNAA